MIYFVIVIHDIEAGSSRTVRSLIHALRAVPTCTARVYVVDNTPGRSSNECQADGFHLLTLGRNAGLAHAYNQVLERAVRDGVPVLVTLDQDSEVTADYLRALVLEAPNLQHDCVCLCPEIISGGRMVSPYWHDRLGRPRYGRPAADQAGCAINSFSAYAVSYLQSVGGFDEHYWLDGLDLVVFRQIQRRGLRVGVVPVQVQHDLSLVSGTVAPWRLVNIAFYEACYLAECCGGTHQLVGAVRLLGRAGKHTLKQRKAMILVRSASACLRGLIKGWGRRRQFNDKNRVVA